MIHHLYPDRETEGAKFAMTLNVFPPPSPVTEPQLIDAVLQALNASPVHRMSAAWPVQNIYRETMIPGLTQREWAMRFLKMEPSDYSTRWDVSMDVWCDGGTVAFSGKAIAHLCAFWVAKGFKFETHNIDELPNFEGSGDIPESTGGSYREVEDDDWGTRYFPLPLHDKIVRYHWVCERNGHVFLRCLDIRLSVHGSGYEYVIQEEGNPELIGYSERPVSRYLLEVQLQAELLPTTTSAPYVIGGGWWLDYATTAYRNKSEAVVET